MTEIPFQIHFLEKNSFRNLVYIQKQFGLNAAFNVAKDDVANVTFASDCESNNGIAGNECEKKYEGKNKSIIRPSYSEVAKRKYVRNK